MEIYNGSFDNIDSVIGCFELQKSDLDGVEILYAEYDNGAYDGQAWVLFRKLFRKDNQLYEVSASHCSCYGLEGQWEPGLTTVKALFMRPNLVQCVRDMFE